MNNTEQDHLYQQNTDFELIEMLSPFTQEKTFIDIGAEKGTFTKFLASKRFNGCFFEPLPTFGPELTAIAEETKCHFFSLAVDSIDGKADFYTAFDHTDNPMDYFSTMHPLNGDTRINHKKTTTVTCRSLDSMLQEGLINKTYGVVKIDTEGNDLNVLKGMKNIVAEVLMCEYFMPGIYAGWELGHPLGLIEEAKQLGFNHFLAIKRIDEYETVSLNHNGFIEKQWGNLIFMKDSIFHAAKEKISEVLEKKSDKFYNDVVATTQNLHEVNNERLNIINDLKKACEERLTLINQLHAQIEHLPIEKIKKSWRQNLLHTGVSKVKKYFTTSR